MRQKVLLIVPHQDDELFVGGGLFRTLARCGDYEAYVVYMTNGDFFPYEAQVRLREAQRVLNGFCAVEESHIFFLGYGDGWKGGVHLYHQDGEEPLVSMAGRTETYGLEEHGDYRYTRSGRHSAYRRADWKRDLKDVIAEVQAEILLVVDFDKHADHRAASLLAEECLGEIFRENVSYRPLVLKRFGYDGVWKGC
ncbi:MAG: PIG-L family deacetylase, partial [Lachnospiraceae bacterium]|nr:PIG-L family deacetylase [Lachnospiraceae bacterium]